jgi:hypothetical protein
MGKCEDSIFFHTFSFASNLTSPFEIISPIGSPTSFASTATPGKKLVERRNEQQRKWVKIPNVTLFFMLSPLH